MALSAGEHREIPPTDFLTWLFEDTGTDPEQDILIDAYNDTRRINTRQAITLVRKLVAGLKAVGLELGDAVCVHAFNDILYPILYFGIIGAGGTFVGSNPSYKSLELTNLFSLTKPKFFVVEETLLQDVLPTLKAAEIPLSRMFVFSPESPGAPMVTSFRSWETLLQYGEQDWIRTHDVEEARSTVAALLSTSGTTGLPKIAVISHYALVAAGVSMQCSEKKPYQVLRLISLPLFHAFGASFVHICAFHAGETTYIMRKFDLGIFADCICRYQITDIAVVPPILVGIVKGQITPLQLQSLRQVWCAGSPLSQALNESMCRLLSGAAMISQIWGMTEFGRISSFGCEKDTTGSVGRLLPNTQARVVDEQGHELCGESEEAGELQIRGRSMMSGYLKNLTATCDVLDDGWLRTGDFGFVRDGKVYISGRIKELIKVRGWQVAPAELESILLLHPAVVDVAVVGIQLPSREADGEFPRAYVVVDSVVSESDELAKLKVSIMSFLSSKLASFKALQGGVVFVKSIPRNGNGKIVRRLLRTLTAIDGSSE